MFRRSTLVLAAMVAVLVGLLAAPVATAAVATEQAGPMAEGGCGPQKDQYPVPGGRAWRANACSSDDGVRVYADGYVQVVGSIVAGCQVRIAVIDLTTGYLVAQRADSCYAGHHPAVPATKVPGHEYWSQLRVNTNQTYVYWTSKVTT